MAPWIGVRYPISRPDARLTKQAFRGKFLSEQKPEESFRVVDRRLFNAEGELRQDVAEQERNARDNPPPTPAAAPQAAPATAQAPEPPPEHSPAFENLIRMLGSNAAMVLGAYADPRTGQPIVDPEAARELIDMLDALREKTAGRLSPEENSLLLDLLGKLKMTYLEITQAVASQAMKAKAESRP
ncbi:MAG: DUF1844 domain-containing protein [Candidatus Acidiferrales bacterium]